MKMRSILLWSLGAIAAFYMTWTVVSAVANSAIEQIYGIHDHLHRIGRRVSELEGRGYNDNTRPYILGDDGYDVYNTRDARDTRDPYGAPGAPTGCPGLYKDCMSLLPHRLHPESSEAHAWRKGCQAMKSTCVETRDREARDREERDYYY